MVILGIVVCYLNNGGGGVLAAIVMIMLILSPVWVIIGALSSKGRYNVKQPPSTIKKNPIDKHMDYYHGDIDWLRKGKL